ncbi:MAG: ATP-binding protein [Oscillospiraceae bacterium]|nr:ATP-binding protein [Oscillospiraceae bacterium]
MQSIDKALDLISVFDEIRSDGVFASFRQMLWHTLQKDEDAEDCRAGFCADLYNIGHTEDWTAYLTEQVLMQENACTYFASRGESLPECIEAAARCDLRALSLAAAVKPEMLAEGESLPCWRAHPIDLESLYFERLSEIGKHGFGIFAKYRMFHMELSDKTEKGYVLEPAAYPDPIRLEDLIGYDLQRKQIIDNTRALVHGSKAANTLLYGDAGTGKSATVKAVANTFAEEGLRLIELSKNELHLLPKLLDELGANPLKFILFIDDLSFQDNDDDFSALKAVLEGSISARTRNTVIYATSNRRHIVRETFSQRAGDEIHRNDTMQETISLSERFGLTVYFEKPNKSLYLDIVKSLAEQQALSLSEEELALEAERFAMRKSGRSARAARQFIERLAADEALKNSQ